MPEKRNYYLKIHGTKPRKVFIEKNMLTEMKNTKDLEQVEDGWHFDSVKNVTHIKVKTQQAQSSFSATIFKNSS